MGLPNSTFTFGFQFWFLGCTLIIFTNLMLCKIIFKMIINFIIEGSMSIFIVHIGIIMPLFHFDHINFKVSSVIKIINFNEIKKMAHLVKLVIFHVNVITCEIFNLPPIYCIFARKTHFLRWKISNNLVTWYPNYVKWHGSIHLQLS
jgi:hypothetical protein